ncbi:MAG: PorT family protein [Bacteroidales bacterium]|jgi:hypothetical protein|nr:PorT family protein [Bacteroidales bacterium]
MARKPFWVIAALMTATAVTAQAQFRIGFKGGYNINNVYGVSGGIRTSSVEANQPTPEWKMKSGFQFGAVSEIPLTNAFYLQPSVVFKSQGFKDVYVNPDGKDYKWTFAFYGLQVPVNIQYKVDLGIPDLIFQAGPYIGYGFRGKLKKYVNNVVKTDQKLKYGEHKSSDILKPQWDYGLTVGAGVQVSRVQLSAGYSMSFSEMTFVKNVSRPYNVKMKTNEIFVTLSFFFGRYESIFPEEE